jgi:pimeloyl-ACP methyl ester carboxylesterase
MSIAEKTFSTNEMTLNYAEGPDNGPPLVLIHGASGRWQNWLPFLGEPLSGWHVYAIDLRGHGKSAHAASNAYCIENYTQDVKAFLRDEVRQPAVLVGHSLGALVSLFTAAEAPQQVRALVLHDPPLYIWHSNQHDPSIVDYFTWVKATLGARLNDTQLVEHCSQKLREWGVEPETEMVDDMAGQLSSLDLGVIDTLVNDRIIGESDLIKTLRAVRCPVTFVQADQTKGGVMRDEDADQVRALCSQAVIMKVPGASHDIMEVGDLLMTQVAHLRTAG